MKLTNYLAKQALRGLFGLALAALAAASQTARAVTLTESTSQTITPSNSVACTSAGRTLENHYWRSFNLDTLGVVGGFTVTSVELGIENATAGGGGPSQPYNVNVYSNVGGPFPAGTLSLVGSIATVIPNQVATIFSVPVTGTVPYHGELVVEVSIPDGIPAGHVFFAGSNASPETAPTYLSSPPCGIPNPTTLASVGYPDMHIVMNVLGNVVPVLVNSIVYQKDDAVPGAGGPSGVPAGATFTALGIPAVNAAGQQAFFGKYKSPSGSGAAIFAGGQAVIKIGDTLPGGVQLKAVKDPVLDGNGYVAFAATLKGTGITAANDSAIVSNAPLGTFAIVAQEGTQAVGAPVGALWKTFTSVAAPGGASAMAGAAGFAFGGANGVLFLGALQVGTGGITSATDYGVWSADTAGVLHLVLQEGTTGVGGKTVKGFVVLKAVSKSPGQTHAHNTHAEMVSKVTFTDGFQAVVHTNLP